MKWVCVVGSKQHSQHAIRQTGSALSTGSARIASSKLTSPNSWVRRIAPMLPARLATIHASCWTPVLVGTIVLGEREGSMEMSGDGLGVGW